MASIRDGRLGSLRGTHTKGPLPRQRRQGGSDYISQQVPPTQRPIAPQVTIVGRHESGSTGPDYAAHQGSIMPQVTIARYDGSCSPGTGTERGRDRWEQRRLQKCPAPFMAAAHVLVWAVCVLRVALATVYFQEEFLDGGEGATPAVQGS